MKRKAAAEADNIDFVLPKKPKLTSWQLYLKKYALTEGCI